MLSIYFSGNLGFGSANMPSGVPNAVSSTQTHQRGRPKKIINPDLLREAIAPERNISIAELQRNIGVSAKTIRRRMDENGITREYSTISNSDLDLIVKDYLDRKPHSGRNYVQGHLRSLGIRVQMA